MKISQVVLYLQKICWGGFINLKISSMFVCEKKTPGVFGVSCYKKTQRQVSLLF